MQANQGRATEAVCMGLIKGTVICIECVVREPPTGMNNGCEGIPIAKANMVAFCLDNRRVCGLNTVLATTSASEPQLAKIQGLAMVQGMTH